MSPIQDKKTSRNKPITDPDIPMVKRVNINNISPTYIIRMKQPASKFSWVVYLCTKPIYKSIHLTPYTSPQTEARYTAGVIGDNTISSKPENL
jgi:hypothetical protein